MSLLCFIVHPVSRHQWWRAPFRLAALESRHNGQSSQPFHEGAMPPLYQLLLGSGGGGAEAFFFGLPPLNACGTRSPKAFSGLLVSAAPLLAILHSSPSTLSLALPCAQHPPQNHPPLSIASAGLGPESRTMHRIMGDLLQSDKASEVTPRSLLGRRKLSDSTRSTSPHAQSPLGSESRLGTFVMGPASDLPSVPTQTFSGAVPASPSNGLRAPASLRDAPILQADAGTVTQRGAAPGRPAHGDMLESTLMPRAVRIKNLVRRIRRDSHFGDTFGRTPSPGPPRSGSPHKSRSPSPQPSFKVCKGNGLISLSRGLFCTGGFGLLDRLGHGCPLA